MQHWIIAGPDAGQRLDAWLAARPEIGTRGKARTAIECGKVFLNGEELVFSDGGRRLAAGDRVEYWPDRPGSSRPRSRAIVATRHALSVVHQDAHLLVVDKPPGWLVEPLPGEEEGEVTLRDLLADHLRAVPRVRPYVVHRIDRDTSGLVLFALTPAARDHLKAQFERRTPERVYLAVVQGIVTPSSGTWTDKLAWDKQRLIQKVAHAREERAKDAIARYRVLEQFDGAAVLEVRLVTGKRNQIRVQAALRGFPLVGERLYQGLSLRGKTAEAPRGPGRRPYVSAFPRQALHAARLAFEHPETGRRVEYESPVPDDITALIERLRDAESRSAR